MRPILPLYLLLSFVYCATANYPHPTPMEGGQACKGFRIFQSGYEFGVLNPKGEIFFPAVFRHASASEEECYLGLGDASLLEFALDPERSLQVIVASDILNFREEPSPTGKILDVLKMGNILHVSGFSTHKDRFNGLQYHWLRVQYGNKTGWINSGFVSSSFEVQKEIVLFLKLSPERTEEAPAYDAIRFDLARGKKIVNFPLTGSSFSFSPDLNYIATSFHTDVVGKLTFYDARQGKKISEHSFTLHPLEWKGNSLPFENIVYTGNGCVLWEEVRFENGEFFPTRKRGKAPFHRFDSKPDRRCDSTN